MIASAMAENRVNAENPQYALTEQYVDAFAKYVAALTELGAPVTDATAFGMEKYGATPDEADPGRAEPADSKGRGPARQERLL